MTHKCERCGTEYPNGVAQEDGTCDWCPGEVVKSMVQSEESAALDMLIGIWALTRG